MNQSEGLAEGNTTVPTQTAADTILTARMKRSSGTFRLASLIYAVFSTFCLYKNASGITVPFFMAATGAYYIFCMKRLGVEQRKEARFYLVGIVMLGMATSMTDNQQIIIMNYMAGLVLLCIFLIRHFYEDKDWGIGKYAEKIITILAGSVGNAPRAIADFDQGYRTNRRLKMNSKVMAVMTGLAIALPLLVLVVVLLASADAVFNSLTGKIFANLVMPQNTVGILFMMGVMYSASYGMVARMAKSDASEQSIDRRTHEPVIAITFTSLLAAVYLIFSIIQIRYLFIGKMAPVEGYTYAGYAREGFFQLMFVCAINLIVVLACLSYFRKNKTLTTIITVISICTYIMTASSAMRMMMYIQSYDLTFLRVMVLWALLVIAFLLAGLLAGIYREGFPLFRYCAAVVMVLYICLAFGHPDYWIAEYNLNREAENPDMSYLRDLSADAAPAISNYLKEKAGTMDAAEKELFLEYFKEIQDRASENGFRGFNVSRHMAVGMGKELY